MQTANEIPANVSKDRLTTLIGDKQDFDVSSEGPSSGISNVIIPNERPLLEKSKSFFIAQVVKRSFDTFASFIRYPHWQRFEMRCQPYQTDFRSDITV